MLIVSGINSIIAEFEDVMKILYGFSHKLRPAFFQIVLTLYIS